MNNRIIKAFLLTAILGGAAMASSACTGGDGKIHVKFWHTMGHSNQELLNRMIDDFNKQYPDVVIEHSAQGDYGALSEKLRTAIPAGTTPTMAFCYPDHVANYMDSNAVISVDEFIKDPELGFQEADGAESDYVDAYWKEGQQYQKSGIYSVPFAKSTEVLFYNKTKFEQYGLTVPTTWAEMWTTCQYIKTNIMDAGLEPSLVMPMGYDSDSNLFITLCQQRGIGYTTNENVTKASDHILFNNAQAKAMVTELKGYYEAGLFATKGCLENNAYTSTYFTEGKTWMSIGSTGGTSYQTSTNFTVAVAPAPVTGSGEGQNLYISQGPSICFFRKGSKAQKQAAWNFYKFITRAQYTAAYSALTGYEPVRSSAYELPTYQNYLAGTTLQATVSGVTATLNGRYYNSAVFYGSETARAQVGTIFANVFLGTASLDEAFANAYSKTIEATKL